MGSSVSFQNIESISSEQLADIIIPTSDNDDLSIYKELLIKHHINGKLLLTFTKVNDQKDYLAYIGINDENHQKLFIQKFQQLHEYHNIAKQQLTNNKSYIITTIDNKVDINNISDSKENENLEIIKRLELKKNIQKELLDKQSREHLEIAKSDLSVKDALRKEKELKELPIKSSNLAIQVSISALNLAVSRKNKKVYSDGIYLLILVSV